LKDLILIENDRHNQFSSIEELISFILGDNYYNITDKEKRELMELNARAYCLNTNIKIATLNELNNNNVNNMFIIQDEISYILSLLIINRYTLLEKTTSNIFTSELNKDNIEDNYIIVNRFANELLDKHIRKIKNL